SCRTYSLSLHAALPISRRRVVGMEPARQSRRLHPAWWTLILIVTVAGVVVVCSAMYAGSFNSYARVALAADRSGLVMEPGARVRSEEHTSELQSLAYLV